MSTASEPADSTAPSTAAPPSDVQLVVTVHQPLLVPADAAPSSPSARADDVKIEIKSAADPGDDKKQPQQAQTQQPAEEDSADPLDPLVAKPSKMFERVSLMDALANVGYLTLFGVGLGLTIDSELAKDQPDFGSTFGSLLADSGISCLLIATWQLLNSSELAFRKYKYAGLCLSLAMIVAGFALLGTIAINPGTVMEIAGGICLSQGIEPFLTTVLLLEPKEKETLAMPYVNNFVTFVANVLKDKQQRFTILVPSSSSLCEHIQQRMKTYRELKKFGEEQLSGGGFRKFGTTVRRIKGVTHYFDVPSMLNGASPNKLYLFEETLAEYLDEKKKLGQLLNVFVMKIHSFTLAEIDRNILAAEQQEDELRKQAAAAGGAQGVQCCGVALPCRC